MSIHAEYPTLRKIARDTLFEVQDLSVNLTEAELRTEYVNRLKAVLKGRYPHLNLVGAGTEAIVVDHPDLNDRVVAIEHSSYWQAELNLQFKFHVQRLLSTLFPHNFPAFTQMGQQPLIYSHREKIAPGSEQIRYPFSEVERVLTDLGLSVVFDKGPSNFMTAQDGGEYYLDQSSLDWSNWQDLNPNRLETFFTETTSHQYTPAEQAACLHSLKRLQVLALFRYLVLKLGVPSDMRKKNPLGYLTEKQAVDSLEPTFRLPHYPPAIKEALIRHLQRVDRHLRKQKPELAERFAIVVDLLENGTGPKDTPFQRVRPNPNYEEVSAASEL